MKNSLIILWLVLASAACTILPAAPAQDVYQLPASSLSPAATTPLPWSLCIAQPTASGMIDSNRIIVKPNTHSLNAYQQARWNGRLPVLWRDYLLDAFYKDGRIRHLSTDSDEVHSDYTLATTLRSFHSEYHDGRVEVVIHLDALLIDSQSKRIVSGQRFSATEGVEGEQVAAVVAALGRAGDRITQELVNWASAGMAQ